MSLTLVVMAAGIGSRYGGLKQMDPIGPSGEFLIDYSIHDAIQAGFDRIAFVIRHDIEQDFKATIGARVEKKAPVEYVFQEIDSIPPGYSIPPDRKKPWGTAHAILVCEKAINGPFAVINADDFYGRESYAVIARFLRETAGSDSSYGMVGFTLRNTLSEHGSVARGVCQADPNGNLESITECTGIKQSGAVITCDSTLKLTGNELVSMNMWGFKPSIFGFLKNAFTGFLAGLPAKPNAEFYIPGVIDTLIKSRKINIKVLETKSSWFGMTNRADKEAVAARIRKLVASEIYPENLLSLH